MLMLAERENHLYKKNYFLGEKGKEEGGGRQTARVGFWISSSEDKKTHMNI